MKFRGIINRNSLIHFLNIQLNFQVNLIYICSICHFNQIDQEYFITDKYKNITSFYNKSHSPTMKKFKKPLSINLPEEQSHEASSPKNSQYKDIKERPLLMYNEHTIASSANNEDQEIQDHQHAHCEQFGQYCKNPFQSNKTEEEEGSESVNKFQKYKKFNVIEFEQFSIQNNSPKQNNEQNGKNFMKQPHDNQKIEFKNVKKSFSIEIPEQQKNDKQDFGGKLAFDGKGQSNTDKRTKVNITKQPPAPSNKSKVTKNINRHFIFPTNDDQSPQQHILKNQKTSAQIKTERNLQEQYNLRIQEISKQWLQKVQELNRNFQRERQEFYKQKSTLEKDLMIKDGQIQMLQKLITNKYSPKQGNINTSFTNSVNPINHQFGSNQRSEYRNFHAGKTNNSFYISDDRLNTLQTILLEKDLQINTLLEKINEQNVSIQKKNNELQEIKIQILKCSKANQSLKNEIFLYEKKEQSEKLTKQFYKVKQSLNQVHQASVTPKGFSKPKWEEEITRSKEKSVEGNEFSLRGIDDLHKRLQSLKMNRIELQNRGKIKSQIGYSQTSKNKTKGTFNFKGKFYDRDRDYVNHSRLY